MRQELLIDDIPGECRVALVEDGAVVEVDIDRNSQHSLIGNIYWGRADSVVPSLQAAFITLNNGPQAFLSIRDSQALYPDGSHKRPPRLETFIHEGQWVLVQVTKDSVSDKGPRVTASPSLAGRFLVYQPLRAGISISSRIQNDDERSRLEQAMQEVVDKVDCDGGFIVRTVANGADLDVLTHEAEQLANAWQEAYIPAPTGGDPVCIYEDLPPRLRALRDWAMPEVDHIRVHGHELHAAVKNYIDQQMPDLSDRIEVYTGAELLFEEYGVEAAIDEALEVRLELPTRGWVSIEQTEALTAVDVNSGGFRREGNREDVALKSNLAAVPIIARQLRLRDIGGQVVIDFINMHEQENRQAVADAMEEAMATDKAPHQIMGWSRLGLMEITRRRTRRSLPDLLAGQRQTREGRVRSVPSTGLDILRLATLETECTPTGTIRIAAHPAVVKWLNNGPLVDLTTQTSRAMEAKADDDMAVDEFDLYADASNAE